MKNCPHCNAANAPENRFCQQCGRSFEIALTRPSTDATVLMSGTLLHRGPVQQTHDVDALFATKSRAVIGRAPDCDLFLSHPTVSRYHALLERQDDGLWIIDLGSVNGIRVGRQRIATSRRLHEGDVVGIGPFLLSLTGGVIRSLDNSRGLRLEARELVREVIDRTGSTRRLLDQIDLVVNPGEFVTLLGPSGSGKSTLMDCLNGRRRATAGQVLANGVDFYRHFDNFRQSLGYVPQKDIVHDGLTVERALLYTARLRLPTDTDPEEMQTRVESVLREMELGPHRSTLIANLSGGQIKRVSLGAELIAEPSLLYIDEATSGLDAGTEARMMRLFRRLADQGRSILCITHNVDNVDQCHLILVLVRGRLVYYGPPKEGPGYFAVSRISDIYDRLGKKEPAEWEKEFHDSAFYREYVLDRQAMRPEPVRETDPASTLSLPAPAPAPTERSAPAEPAALASSRLGALLSDTRKMMERWPMLADSMRHLTAGALRLRERLRPVREGLRQFRVLTARYAELILGDARGLRLLLLQAPIVAVFLLLGFVGKEYRQEIPLPRPLKPEERRVLLALQAMDQLIQKGEPLDEKQKKALRQVKFQVDSAAGPMSVDASKVVALLQKAQNGKLTPLQRKILEEAKFTVEVDGTPNTVTGAEMFRASEDFHKLKILDKLLKIEGPAVPDQLIINPRFTYVLLFIVVVVVLWFGCNNASKEIVKEEAIYGRERAVNLRILPYLASKFLVMSLITILHVLILMLLLYGVLELAAWYDPDHHSTPPAQLMLGYVPQFGILALLAMSGVALGLLLSACVSSPDRANALLPYVLIPQMILGGGILNVEQGILAYLATTLSPAYWAFRALHLHGQILPPSFPGATPYPDNALWPALALAAQTAVLLGLTAWALRRKDL